MCGIVLIFRGLKTFSVMGMLHANGCGAWKAAAGGNVSQTDVGRPGSRPVSCSDTFLMQLMPASSADVILADGVHGSDFPGEHDLQPIYWSSPLQYSNPNVE
jgi:hypothetical protein